MTPAGTSDELDVQNEWEENTHTHTALRKNIPGGVHPVHFPVRQGENERRPISSAHFTLDVNGYPVVSPNDQGAPCCVVYPLKSFAGPMISEHKGLFELQYRSF